MTASSTLRSILAPQHVVWRRARRQLKAPFAQLNDVAWLEAVLRAEPALAEACLQITHQFQPQGISLVLLAEHLRLCLHTWPELQLATLDVTAPAALQPQALAERVQRRVQLKASAVE